MMNKVEIFTDGACKGNPGPGGWGAILRYGTTEKEIYGASKNTTCLLYTSPSPRD